MNGRTICRLCLESVCHNKFSSLENVRDLLDALSLNLDLQVIKDPVVCYDCTSILEDYSDFMLTCVQTDNHLFSINTKKSSETDLVDVKQNRSLIFDETSKDERVCRFCSKVAQNEYFTDLYETKENVFIVEMLTKYIIPGVNLSITEKLLTCEACFDLLKTIHSFIFRCLIVEDKIKKYVELEGTDANSHVELSYVQETKPILLQEISCDNLKEEKIMSDKVVNTTRTGVEIKDIIEEQIKYEEVDIKSEASDDDSYYNTATSSHSDLTCDFKNGEPSGSLQQTEQTINDKNSKGRYQCTFCPYQHRFKYRLNQHMLFHLGFHMDKDPQGIKYYQCKFCSHKTRYRGNLPRHNLIHQDASEIELYKCDMCPFTNKRKEVLKRHLLIHEDPSKIHMHKCELCLFKTKKKDDLVRHRKVHEDTWYTCEFCPYTAKRKCYLKNHVLKHENSSRLKIYKCEVCLFQTKYKYILVRHQQIHSGTKYKCDLCPYASSRKENLRVHVKIHHDSSKIQMHKCTMCLFQTKRKDVLVRHGLVHQRSEGTKYKCELCPHTTKRKDHLKKHALTHHTSTK